jgi:predicted dehydrogenase
MKDVRFGIIGCGAIHSTHCDAITKVEGAVLGAVCDVVAERAKAAGETYGVPAFADLDDFWPHVDAVCVCVPSGNHAEVGIEAAKHGKHVLTEKPIDVRLGPALALIGACESAGVKNGCISQHRFAPDILRMKELVSAGELGRILHADMFNKWFRTQNYYDSGAWRGTWELDGGGCLMNQGVHYVDMLQWIMGGIRAVQAQTRTLAHQIEVEDTAIALVEFANGALGVISASTSIYPGFAERIEVHGLFGSAVVEGDILKMCRVDEDARARGMYGGGVSPGSNAAIIDAGTLEGASGRVPPHWGDQHRAQIADFTKAIQDDREPAVTCQAALEPLKTILAIYESSRRGGVRVELESLEA